MSELCISRCQRSTITADVLTGNENVLVVGNEVFKDFGRAVHDVHIAPVNPRMLWLQGSGEKVVAGLAHGLPPRTLCVEGVPLLDTLAQVEVKVLFNDHGAAERDVVGPLLDSVEFGRKHGEGIILGVGDEEGEVDQVVRIRELGEQLKVLGEVGGSVLEGRDDEDFLLIDDGLAGGLDGVEVDVLDRFRVDLERCVVVENDGRLHVRIPSRVLVLRHVYRRRRRSPAVEAVACQQVARNRESSSRVGRGSGRALLTFASRTRSC